MKFKIDSKKCKLHVVYDPAADAEKPEFEKLAKELDKFGLTLNEQNVVKGGLVDAEFYDDCSGEDLVLEEWLGVLQNNGVDINIFCCNRIWEVSFDYGSVEVVKDRDILKAMDKAYKRWWRGGRATYAKKDPDISVSLQDIIEGYLG